MQPSSLSTAPEFADPAAAKEQAAGPSPHNFSVQVTGRAVLAACAKPDRFYLKLGREAERPLGGTAARGLGLTEEKRCRAMARIV